jgi:hypothetical protein
MAQEESRRLFEDHIKGVEGASVLVRRRDGVYTSLFVEYMWTGWEHSRLTFEKLKASGKKFDPADLDDDEDVVLLPRSSTKEVRVAVLLNDAGQYVGAADSSVSDRQIEESLQQSDLMFQGSKGSRMFWVSATVELPRVEEVNGKEE